MPEFVAKLSRYWKALIAGVALVVYVGNEVIQQLEVFGADGAINTEDWLRIALAAGTAYGVWRKANTPPAGEPADPNVSEVGPGADR